MESSFNLGGGTVGKRVNIIDLLQQRAMPPGLNDEFNRLHRK